MKNAKLTEDLKNLPVLPGVYLMKDEIGQIIYVGKAVNLKRRVGSYFHSKQRIVKVEKLVANIHSFEIIITDTELEALVLECKLIKKYRPRYNTLMKNDWRYPYIKITNEPYPRIITVASPENDGAEYFGPYKGYEDIEQMLGLIRKLWKIRNCKTFITDEKANSPCFNFHIDRCKGPCSGNVTLEEYLSDIQDIKKFLLGNYSEFMNRIKKEMNIASKNMFYEKAALYRDNFLLLNKFVKRQKLLLASIEEKDVLVFTASHIDNKVLVFLLRYGKILDKTQIMRNTPLEDAKKLITELLRKHYSDTQILAREIKKSDIDEIIVIQGWLHHTKANKVCVEIKRQKLKRPLDTAVIKGVKALTKLLDTAYI